MADILDSTRVRSGTWGTLWLNGEQVSECYGGATCPKSEPNTALISSRVIGSVPSLKL